MKKLQILLLSCLLVVSEGAESLGHELNSEMKVKLSSVIAKVKLTDVSSKYDKAEKRLETTLTLEVLELLKGKAGKAVQVVTYPSSYSHAEGIAFVADGFGIPQVKKEKIGTEYIVYLKKDTKSYRLLLDEGQCFREISTSGDMVSNAGKNKWFSLQKEILAIKKGTRKMKNGVEQAMPPKSDRAGG